MTSKNKYAIKPGFMFCLCVGSGGGKREQREGSANGMQKTEQSPELIDEKG